MRISDRYIGKQVLHDTLLAVVVLSMVLILGTVFREVRPLLVEKNVPLGLVLRFILNVFPSTMMYTLPWGFLSAIVLVFGRLSTKQELTAFRVAGISLPRLAAPVFVLGALLSALCLWVNAEVAPAAKQSSERQLLDAAKADPRSLLNPGAVGDRFKGLKVFVDGKEGDSLTGVHIYKNNEETDGTKSRAYLYAGRASLVTDQPKQQLRATLDNAYIELKRSNGDIDSAWPNQAEPWFFDYSDKKARHKPGMMTNTQLREDLAAIDPADKDAKKRRDQNRAEIAKRFSLSMACLAFACVAVPLGISARRKDTSSGMVISLLVGTGYFFFLTVAKQPKNEIAAILLLWTPNILCVVLGLFLFRRARFK